MLIVYKGVVHPRLPRIVMIGKRAYSTLTLTLTEQMNGGERMMTLTLGEKVVMHRLQETQKRDGKRSVDQWLETENRLNVYPKNARSLAADVLSPAAGSSGTLAYSSVGK